MLTSKQSHWPQRSCLKLNTKWSVIFAGIYVHVTCNSHYDDLWGHDDLQMTLEVTSELTFEISGLNEPMPSAFLAPKSHYFKIVVLPFLLHWPAGFAAGKKQAFEVYLMHHTVLDNNVVALKDGKPTAGGYCASETGATKRIFLTIANPAFFGKSFS